MKETRTFLASLGYPEGDFHSLPSSAQRFSDGAQYRIELPSVEGPAALAATLKEIDRYGLKVHRAALGMDIVRRYCPEAVTSQLGAADLGIPVMKES